jgi:subtilisin family serine protease
MSQILLAAFVLAFTFHQIQASQLRQRQLNQRELEEGTRIFARYRGQRGHRIAERCARNIIQDNDGDDIIILQGNGLCMEQLTRDTDIIEADFDNEVFALGSSSPADLTRTLEEMLPWGLEMIQANQLDTGDNNITVCIVDSGLAIGHPDFDHDMITGTDTVKFYGPAWNWSEDKSGHGTHVAGTIAALAGNDQGVSGVGRFRLHIARALGDDGRGYESDIRKAVEQCVDAGAQVINLSLGGSYMSLMSSQFYTEVVEEKGIMMIAAAGNDGNQRKLYPASHPSVISVGAVYEWGTRWINSNKNDQVEFMGPGHKIWSTTSTTTSVQVDDFAYIAVHIPGTHFAETSTGKLVYCEADDKKCKDADDGDICIFSRDGTSIQDMLKSCVKGGGAGAIIFDANSNDFDSWSADDSEIGIPAVAVKEDFGIELMTKLGETVTIGDSQDSDGVQYAYEMRTGTSMASPHVAAAAALLWSNHGDCTNHQIRYALAMNAENPDGSCDDYYGYGIVKVHSSSEWLKENPCDTWDVPLPSQGGCSTV